MNKAVASERAERFGFVPRPVRAAFANPRMRRRLVIVGSAVGWGLIVAALIVLTIHDGGYGYDAYAYWLAGRNVIDGVPLYWPHDEGALGAYRYPPLFAQLWAPFTVLPALAFSWLWRLVCLVSLRYLAGSWVNVGVWGLVPFTWTELSIANVTFPTAALTILALRGRTGWAAWAGALKLAPLLALPYLWIQRPDNRRYLLLGVASVAVAFSISFLISPNDWSLYVSSFSWMSSSDTDSFGVVKILPNGFHDALLRLGVAIGLVTFAAIRGSDRLAYVATIISVPVLGAWRLTPLLAVYRLGNNEVDAQRAQSQRGNVDTVASATQQPLATT